MNTLPADMFFSVKKETVSLFIENKGWFELPTDADVFRELFRKYIEFKKLQKPEEEVFEDIII